MKTLVTITNELIEQRGSEYSPELFENILNEVKSTPKYVEHNKKRNEWLNSISTNKKDYLVSFMSNHLTTDSRLK